MKKAIRQITILVVLLICSINVLCANERPKLHELRAKKLERLESGVVPMEKKGKWGYATYDGKYVISPVFVKALPVNSRQVAFVAYENKSGRTVWTPIDLKGAYLTESEFDSVTKDFDDRGLAIVQKGNKYGVIDHTGKMVVGNSFAEFADRGPVYILYNKGSGCVAIAKDKSDKGYTTYSFAENEHVVVLTETGYGVLTPKKFNITADFIYDSVKELSGCNAYVLQKGNKKYLYSRDMVSSAYDDVVPGNGNRYFAVKSNGKWGALTPSYFSLLSCAQEQIPVLEVDEYRPFYENGERYYVTTSDRKTLVQYDDYLYGKYKNEQSEYLLDNTLELQAKSHVLTALRNLYGTREFSKVQQMPVAIEFAENLRFVLLSHDNSSAQYLDIVTGWVKDADDVIYRAFPSKTGAPAYATCLRNGKFGIIDIRNKDVLVPFKCEKIEPLRNGYVLLHIGGTRRQLYNVLENEMITPSEDTSVSQELFDLGWIVLNQPEEGIIYSLDEHRVVFRVEGFIDRTIYIQSDTSEKVPVVSAKEGDVYALYSLTTGEKLTDCEFEWIGDSLFEGKYIEVDSDGRGGVYDLRAKKYVFLYDDYLRFWEAGHYAGDDYVYAWVEGEGVGLCNLTKNRMLFEPVYDDLDVVDGYVSLVKDKKHYLYSLKHNSMIDYLKDCEGVLRFPIEGVTLLEDGWVLLFASPDDGDIELPRGEGIYNLNEGGETYISEDGGYDYMKGDYVYVYSGDAQAGNMANYKTDKCYYWGYCYPGEDDLILKSEYPLLKCDYAIDNCVDEDFMYSEEYFAGEDVKGPDNNAALYNLETDECVIGCEVDSVHVYTSMEYLGCGLVLAEMQESECSWIYDIVSSEWILKTRNQISICSCYNGDLYLKEKRDSDWRYMFIEKSRSFIPVKDGFCLEDYNDVQMVNSQEGCKVSNSDRTGCWNLYVQKHNITSSPCDRISLMYEPK